MNPPVTRQGYLLQITYRLFLLTIAALLAISVFEWVLWAREQPHRSFLMVMIFAAGLVGGFVSIQQRLPKIGQAELQELSASWTSIMLIPINGGIFALVLHLAFLGGILEGGLFPKYYIETPPDPGAVATMAHWMVGIRPDSATDLGKLIFWSFAAGFSERLVPQIIRTTIKDPEKSEPPNAE